MKFWKLHSNSNQPHNQPAATAAHIYEAIQAVPEHDIDTKFMIALQWVTCSRISDILMLRREDLIWDANKNELAMTVKEGKVMGKVDPYTVHTKVTDEYLQRIFRVFLSKVHRDKDRIFPFTNLPRQKRIDRLNNALKVASPTLTSRSVRRGALQTMATEKTPLKTIMQFSGHKSEDTCKRYLDWGRLHFNMKENASAAAKHLRLVTLKA